MKYIRDHENLNQKNVLLRLDLNVPLKKGLITDLTRIDKILPIINFLLSKNSRIIVVSHVGRPKGKKNSDLSMKPICEYLEKKIKKKIKLCDFGGSLGSLYFQHRSLFGSNFIDWNIIEQKHFVKYANKKINIKNLHFYDNLNLLLKKKINAVLFSSSLQYLEYPYQILDKMIKRKIPNIIIHRSPFTESDEIIKIQQVPKHIYDTSYPIRILNIVKICNKLKSAGYKINSKFKLKEEIDGYFYETFYFERKK